MEMIFVMLAVLAAATIGIMTILRTEQKKNAARKGIRINKTNTSIQKYTKYHLFLWNNFLFRGKYRALVERMGQLGVYNLQELRVNCVKYFVQTTGIAWGIAIVGMFCFQDIVSSIILIGFGYMMHNVLVDKKIDAIHFKLVKQMSQTLSSIREAYTQYGSIPDALAECKKGNLVQSAIEKISILLTALDGMEKLEEFHATVPVRILQTFANVCYILNESGDTDTEGGTSSFKQALTFLQNEVDLEIRKLTKQRIAFSMLEYIPIAPLFVIGVVQDFFIANIPGTSIVYNGLIGYIVRLLIALSTVLGYYIISIINSPSAIKTNDRMYMIDSLLRKKKFNAFVTSLCPKKFKSRLKFEKAFKGALSLKDMKYIYATKVVVSTVAAVLVLVVFTLVLQMSREFIYNNTQALTLVPGATYTKVQQDAIVLMDKTYMESPTKMSDEDALSLVYASLPDAYELDKMEQAERLSRKWDEYHALSWKWWFVLIIFAVGAIAWLCPMLMVSLRRYLVKTEVQEDVLQMQTMIATLMYTPLDTLEVIHWLIKTSTIHKDILIFAYHEYPSNPEVAIERLKSKVNSPEFHNMCDRLISTINHVSMCDAFSGLVAERSHALAVRETVQDSTIKKRRSLASPLAMAPLFFLCIGHILLPIGMLGIQEFTKAFSQMGYM